MSLKRCLLLGSLTAGLLLTSVPLAPPAWADTTLTLAPRQSNVTAEGTYSQNGVPLGGTPAFLTVAGPDGTLYHLDQGQTAADGRYKFDWTMPAQAPNGTYTVKIHIEGDIQTATFTFSNSGLSNEVKPVNVGPYRFTGELNAGAKQAVIYDTATGLLSTTANGRVEATVDASKGTTAVRNAATGTTYLTISVPAREKQAFVRVPGAVLTEMISRWGPDAHLLVATEAGSYDLPLKAVNPLLLDSVRNQPTGQLEFVIRQADPALLTEPLRKLSNLGLSDLVPAVEFQVNALTGGSSIPLKDYGDSFVRCSIDLTGAVLSDTLVPSALFLHPEDEQLLPTPSRLFRDSLGHGKMVIARTGNGIYKPIQAKRQFDDLKNFYLADTIQFLASKTVISGKTPTSYDPFGSLTRAEFATLMVRGLGLSDKDGTAPFGDVPRDAWFTRYVNIGSTLGLISGYSSNEFAPQDKITIEQMAALLARGLQYVQGTKPYVDTIRVLEQVSDQDQISSWARNDVALAIQTGILKRTSPLQPTRYATRAESAAMMYNFLQYLQMI